jgi:hypothetical protein
MSPDATKNMMGIYEQVSNACTSFNFMPILQFWMASLQHM